MNFTSCKLYLNKRFLKKKSPGKLFNSDYLSLRWVQGTNIWMGIPCYFFIGGPMVTFRKKCCEHSEVHQAGSTPSHHDSPTNSGFCTSPGKDQRMLDRATRQSVCRPRSVLSSASTSICSALLGNTLPTLKALHVKIGISPQNLRKTVLNSTWQKTHKF